jgi:putative salt-induced outer membrane protein YdiY
MRDASTSVRWRRRLASAAVLAAIVASPAAARGKIDTVALDNGDVLTCEIKDLNRGILRVTTDYFVSTVSIEWVHVDRIVSSQLFEFEMEDGTKYYGGIAADRDSEAMMVVTGLGPQAVKHDSLVRIAQLEERFRDRIDGSIDLGLNAYKSNNEANFNLRSSISYRTKERRISADLNSDLSRRDSAEDKRHSTLNMQYARSFAPKWYWFARPSWERNNELGLDLRSSVAGGAGRFMIQTNNSLLELVGGLSANEERYADRESNDITLEALLGARYELFTFGDREIQLTIGFDLFPSLSDTGRVRTALVASLRHELFSDFYIGLNVDATHDNRPPTEAEKSDWNVVSSIGYKY